MIITRLYSETRKRIPASGLLGNIMKLVLGTGLAQAITLLLSPVITRLYTTADYGVFSFFIAIVAAFSLIATLRYELAIIFAKDDAEAGSVFHLSGKVVLYLSLVLLVVCILIWLFPFRMEPELRYFFWFLPLMVFLLGWTNIFQNWFLRMQKFTLISTGKIWNSAAANGFTLLFGLIGLGAWGLVLGNLAGQVVLVVILLWFFTGKYHKLFPNPPYFATTVAKKYRDLPQSNTIQALLEMLQNYGIIFLSRILFTSNVVGLYALAMRILQAPLWLVGSSISQIYSNEASATYNQGKPILPIFNRTFWISVLVAAPVLLLVATLGPAIFAVVFGESWRTAGVYAAILSPWMFFDFIRYALAQTIIITGKTRRMMFVSLAGCILMAGSMVAGFMIWRDPRGGYALLSATMSLYAISVILWIRQVAHHQSHVIHE